MMDFETYRNRLAASGETIRDVRLNREKRSLASKSISSLSFQTVTINGVQRGLTVLNSDNMNEKKILSLPDEEIPGGAIIFWENNYWIVTEKDYGTEVYTRAMMTQCNHVLRWITEDKEIIERHCVVSDGTKYLTGETNMSHNDNGVYLGDTRISITLPRDEYTLKLGRKNRFLINDEDSDSVLAYRITKPFKIGGVYNKDGAMSFVLSEETTEDSDNFELHIANYYNYFPRESTTEPDNEWPAAGEEGVHSWL